MFSFLLFIIVIVLSVALSRKDRNARQNLDHHSTSYQQGYWDGVRASEAGISTTGHSDTPYLAGIGIAAAQLAASAVPITGQPPAPEMSSAPAKENHVTVNVTLYVASLLLVGGVSLFVNIVAPSPTSTFFFVLLTATAYYGFGFLLYQSMPVLKPVSVTFVGTALAIMPYTGYLLNQSFIHNSSVSWLITSLVCLVAYLYAAIRLHSELIGFFVIVLFVSSADSLAGVFDTGILWFIVLVMASGAAITFVAAMRPRWLPDVLKQPFIATEHVVIPLAVLWSLFLYTQLDAADYAVVFAVATLYYGAAALQSIKGSARRTWLWAAARLTATAAASAATYSLTDSWYMVDVSLTVVGILQVTLSALSLPTRQKLMNQHEMWLWGGFALIIVAALFSLSESHWAAEIAIELAELTVVSALVAAYLKRSELLVFSVYGLALLPLIGGHYAGPLALADWVTCVIYSVLVLLTVIIRARYVRTFNQTNTTLVYTAQIVFSLMVITTGAFANTHTNHWWLTFAYAVVATVAYVTSWLEKDYRIVVGANVLVVITLATLADSIGLKDMNMAYFISAMSLVWFYGSYLVLQSRQRGMRAQQSMWWFAIVVSSGLSLVGLFSSDDSLVKSFILLLFVVGSLMVYEDYERRQLRFTDLGLIIASVGFLRFVGIVAPSTSPLFYSHWLIALMFTLAYLRRTYGTSAGNKDLIQGYEVIGLIIMTIFGYVYSITHGVGSSSVIFIIEHVGVVIYGLMRDNELFTIWGAVGVTLAIFSLMPGLSFLLLPLLGLGMIAAVIYVVTRNKTSPPPQV